jgi:hypothetical protein
MIVNSLRGRGYVPKTVHDHGLPLCGGALRGQAFGA